MNLSSKLFHSAEGKLLFIALSGWFLGTNVIWLCCHRSAPTWDDSWYLTNSLRMFDALARGGLGGYARRFLTILGTKAPLITVLPTPVYLMVGRDFRYAYIVNLVFMPVLFLGVYSIAKTYWSSRVGFLAMYIIGTMPLLYGLSRWYLAEYDLVGLVCFAVCLLVKFANLEDARPAFWFGVTCGLGLLLKITFPLYVLFPFLYAFIRFLRRTETRSEPGAPRKLSKLATLLALTLPVILIAGPWYVSNARRVVNQALFSAFTEEADLYGTGDVFSLRAVRTYLVTLLNAGPSGYYVLLAVVLLGLIGISGRSRALLRSFPKEALVILSLWLLPSFVFLFGRNKDIRFVAPLLPAFALLLAFLLDFSLAACGKWKSPILCFLLTLPLVGSLQTSFRILGDRQLTLGPLRLMASDLGYARMYNRVPWAQPGILKAICDVTTFRAGENKRLVVGTDAAIFNGNNFELAVVQERLPFDVATTAYEANEKDLRTLVSSTAFFVYTEGGDPGSALYNKYGSTAVREVRESATFIEIPYAPKLPDGGRAHIFENLKPNFHILRGEFSSAGIGELTGCEVDFNHTIQLTGISVRETVDFLEVRYRWRCVRRPDREYWCFTHILNERDSVIGYLDHPILGGEPPTWAWKTGDVATEELRFDFSSPQTRKGLHLRLGLFHPASGQRLPIVGSPVVGRTRSLPLTDNNTAVLVDSLADSRSP